MRYSLLTIGVFFIAYCTCWAQEVAVDITVDRLVSRQPYAMTDAYWKEQSPVTHSINSQKANDQQIAQKQSMPENLDNAFALEHWLLLQELKSAPQFDASFLRKRLPIHRNAGSAFRIDKEVLSRMKHDLQVVY